MAGSNVALHVKTCSIVNTSPAALTLMVASGGRTSGRCNRNLPFLISLFGAGFPCPFHKLAVMQEYTNHSEPLLHCVISPFVCPGARFCIPVVNLSCRESDRSDWSQRFWKSTLLKMLGRHQPPSEGEILLMPNRWKAGAAKRLPAKWLIAAAASSGRRDDRA